MDRQTYLEVNLDAIKYNIESIKKYVKGKTIMPVIKANGYGTHINECLDLINEFDIVSVAIVKEGIELRKKGYKKEIFVLNQPLKEDIKNILKYDLTVGVASLEFLESLNEKFKIHLELETGMGRTGFYYEELSEALEIIKRKKIKLEGCYTHFAVADVDLEFTKKQIKQFEKGVNLITKEFNLKYIHSSASNGLINFEDKYSNLVRPGIILYGYKAADDTNSKIKLKPALKLITKVSFIKNVAKGTSISYGRTFIANKEMKIATIPIGYADGIRRELSNKGYVYLNDQKVRIVGTICMDSFMVDVTDTDTKIGDTVFIFDNEHITLDEIANMCNTINYEIMCNISERVPRVFKEEEK